MRSSAAGLVLVHRVAGATACFAGLPSPPWFAAVALADGCLAGPVGSTLAALVQERTPEHLRGRVIGAMAAASLAASLCGLLLIGPLLQLAGFRTTFLILAVGCLATALCTDRARGLRDAARRPLSRPGTWRWQCSAPAAGCWTRWLRPAGFRSPVTSASPSSALFCGWRFELFGTVTALAAALIALATWATLEVAAKLWLGRLRYRPFEWGSARLVLPGAERPSSRRARLLTSDWTWIDAPAGATPAAVDVGMRRRR